MDTHKHVSPEELTKSRHRGDPLADEAAGAIVHARDIGTLHQLLRELATNDQAIPDGLPAEVVAFFEESGRLDLSEADRARLDTASGIFREYGPMVVFALLFRSLPVTYMAYKPAHVLTNTKILVDFPERRIIETAQFVFDVMAEGWYKPGMRGIRSAQKVRLMHAAIRHLLQHESHAKWNDEWGVPISQEDLLATLQTFSIEVLNGLERLHIHLSPEEEDAWFFAWKQIGTIMGVEPKMMPETRAEAEHVQQLIYDQLFVQPPGGDNPTAELIQPLVGFLQNVTDSGFFRSHVLVLMRYMIHNDQWYTEHLKLPKTRGDAFFLWLMKVAMHVYSFLARITDGKNGLVSSLSNHFLHQIYNSKRGGKEVTFQVPASLRAEFELERAASGA